MNAGSASAVLIVVHDYGFLRSLQGRVVRLIIPLKSGVEGGSWQLTFQGYLLLTG